MGNAASRRKQKGAKRTTATKAGQQKLPDDNSSTDNDKTTSTLQSFSQRGPPPSLQALIQLSSSSVNAQEHVCIMAWIGKSKVLFWKLIFLPSTYLGKVPGFEGGMARKECN